MTFWSRCSKPFLSVNVRISRGSCVPRHGSLCRARVLKVCPFCSDLSVLRIALEYLLALSLLPKCSVLLRHEFSPDRHAEGGLLLALISGI